MSLGLTQTRVNKCIAYFSFTDAAGWVILRSQTYEGDGRFHAAF